jgi:hypothetical protein
VGDATGTFRFNLASATLPKPGNYVLAADVKPTSCGEGWIAVTY